MEERAARMGGELIVQSDPGKGTYVKVEVHQ
jgi:signal transduction histidine kinase